MKKIAVMGLVGWNNYGEQFLAKCTEYLIGGQQEVEFIDFEPPHNPIGNMLYYMFIVLSRLIPVRTISDKLVWYGVCLRSKRYFRKHLQQCDKIIFACGSYKYGTQKLWAYYSLAIELAQKMQIKVMFNGVNVQDYNGGNGKCEWLKQHTNYSCVTQFTTRDGEHGVDKLNADYLTDTPVKAIAVGDPAFWIPECYGIQKEAETSIIGINLIRGRIFEDYGGNMTEERLLDFYCDYIRWLESRSVSWELFTNGLKVDYEFGLKVLKKCNMEDHTIRIPESDLDLVKMIAGYKEILGARLHACICAYSLDVPFASFIWDEKMLRFAEITGNTERFLTEDKLDVENMKQCFMYSMQQQYDVKIREEWKQKTKQSIDEFVKR